MPSRAETATAILTLAVFGVAASAGARLLTDFDLDAITIIVLCVLLLWMQRTQARRTRAIGERVEKLINIVRYGPLSAEDLEAIAALKAQAARHPGPGRAVRDA